MCPGTALGFFWALGGTFSPHVRPTLCLTQHQLLPKGENFINSQLTWEDLRYV